MADDIWTLSRAERVEFLALAYRHHLVRSIVTYELWKAGWEGLGEREWDRCVELGDGALVVAELMERARSEGFLDAIRAQTSPEDFERLQQYKIPCPLFDGELIEAA